MMPAPEQPTTEDRLRAALWFAERGFGVFSVWSANPDGTCRCPLKGKCESPGKHPVPTNGLKSATTDPQRITAMLSIPSNPNWGMLPPEGIFVLDVDGEGVQELRLLEAALGPLPATLRTNTAHGQHVFLRWPQDIPRPLGQMFGFVTRWGSGSGTGYVIGPRSIHASGHVYAPADAHLEIADLPQAWAQAVVAPQPKSNAFIEIEGGGYQLPEPGYSGSRYEAILRYIASRYMHGMTREEVLAGVVNVLAPRFANPLDEASIHSRFDRAWRGTAERLGEPLTFDSAVPTISAPVVTLPSWPAAPDPVVYHGVAGSIVRAVVDQTEADPIGILGSLLATVGACMGHHRYIYQGSQQSTNLFTVLVGETASGRKGTAQSIVREVMTGAYPDWQKLIVTGLGSGEGLITHLKRLADSGSTEHRALVLESEFGRLLTVMSREGSTLSPVVRDAWDGVPMGRFLARDGQLVTWHHVGLVAHVTPVELRAKLSDVDAANGFGNRFLWLAVRRTQLVPFPESPAARVQPYLGDLADAIHEAYAPGAEMKWSEQAANRWESLYMRLTSRVVRGVPGALMARSEPQIVRMALIYALLDRSPVIDVAHLAAAEGLWDYAERTIVYVFGSSTGNRHADMLRDLLAEGPLEWEPAKRALGLRHAAELREVVELLVELGIVEVASVPRDIPGRPRRVIQLIEANPANPANPVGARAEDGSKGAQNPA
jgi:hypothetical protein